MDIKHVLSCNPLQPAYTTVMFDEPREARATGMDRTRGRVRRGRAHRRRFGFDNEFPPPHVASGALRRRPIAPSPAASGLAFMDDDGYGRPDLWLSDGWATAQAEEWDAPLYWFRVVDDWWLFTLGGPQLVDPAEPVCHISYYEADAFARWAGGRMPTEAEWEAVAVDHAPEGQLPRLGDPPSEAEQTRAHRSSATSGSGPRAAYSPYPGFRPAPGAVGEYNGKFMVNQYVLRGGSCVTSTDHVRATYRNFFPPSARWPFTGLRLARDT